MYCIYIIICTILLAFLHKCSYSFFNFHFNPPPLSAPADYMQIVEQLTFGPGVSRVCVEVLPVDDGLVEGPETFNVTLTSDDDVVLVPDVATVVIQELDSEWALASI